MLRSLAGDRLNVHSAGTAGRRAPVDPRVAEAVREIGLDLDDAYSKPRDDMRARIELLLGELVPEEG